MQTPLKAALIAAALLTAGGALAAEPAKPQFLQASMNVYRRFPVELREKMVDFYGKALGLQSLSPITLSATQQMILFKVGTGQIKLAAGLKEDRKYQTGGVNDAVGIRLYTLTFPDEAALVERFKAAGYPAPAFKDIGGGRRAALVKDPGGFNLELVIAPGQPADAYGAVEVGINVTDLERSKAFYRDFVGLQELPAVKDAFLGVTKHPYRNGTTTLELWSAGKGLPADTGSAGIQYVVANVEAVDAKAKAEKVTVETPLGGVQGFNIETVWLNDPDGVTNYFYQLLARTQASK
jgi:catechol 2,3-dioxygenase-like lactoylglutathione lyase family enzyme